MKLNKYKLLVGTIAFAAIFTLSTSSAFAFRGDPSVQGPNYSPERHTAMTQAFDENNYSLWSNLMSGINSRITSVINASNFSEFVKARTARLNGDITTANSIRESLGLGLGNGQGRANHFNKGINGSFWRNS